MMLISDEMYKNELFFGIFKKIPPSVLSIKKDGITGNTVFFYALQLIFHTECHLSDFKYQTVTPMMTNQ